MERGQTHHGKGQKGKTTIIFSWLIQCEGMWSDDGALDRNNPLAPMRKCTYIYICILADTLCKCECISWSNLVLKRAVCDRWQVHTRAGIHYACLWESHRGVRSQLHLFWASNSNWFVKYLSHRHYLIFANNTHVVGLAVFHELFAMCL